MFHHRAIIALAISVPVCLLIVWLMAGSLLRGGADAAREAGKGVAEVARAVFGHQELLVFREYLVQQTQASGSELVVGERKAVVSAAGERSNYLGTTHAEVDCPVVATYVIEIDRWTLGFEGGILYVLRRPALAKLPAALDLANARWRGDQALLHFNQDDRLHADLLGRLNLEANAMAVAAAPGMQAIANQVTRDFVRRWLAALCQRTGTDTGSVRDILVVDEMPRLARPPVDIRIGGR